ncbi:hypothetical protein LXL04_002124 [Taraxacum kok-saghyz]
MTESNKPQLSVSNALSKSTKIIKIFSSNSSPNDAWQKKKAGPIGQFSSLCFPIYEENKPYGGFPVTGFRLTPKWSKNEKSTYQMSSENRLNLDGSPSFSATVKESSSAVAEVSSLRTWAIYTSLDSPRLST